MRNLRFSKFTNWRFILVHIIGTVLLSLQVQGQFVRSSQPVSFVPKAPNSAMIERFGNYTVSHYSGLPEISIPLYTIKTASFEIPISIEYHASGIKVMEYPSWVGAGWVLNAGGSIQRQ